MKTLANAQDFSFLDSLFQEDKLPVGMLTRAQLAARRASAALSCAYERYIPIAQIECMSRANASRAQAAGPFELGREIQLPIEVVFDEQRDIYRLVDGEKRLRQARLNRQTHLLAFVEPDRDALRSGRRAIGAHALRIRPDGASHFCYINGAGVTEDYRAYDVYLHCLDAKRLLGRYGEAGLAWESMNRKVGGCMRITIEEADTGTLIGQREGPATLIALEYSLMKCKTRSPLKHAA